MDSLSKSSTSLYRTPVSDAAHPPTSCILAYLYLSARSASVAPPRRYLPLQMLVVGDEQMEGFAEQNHGEHCQLGYQRRQFVQS